MWNAAHLKWCPLSLGTSVDVFNCKSKATYPIDAKKEGRKGGGGARSTLRIYSKEYKYFTIVSFYLTFSVIHIFVCLKNYNKIKSLLVANEIALDPTNLYACTHIGKVDYGRIRLLYKWRVEGIENFVHIHTLVLNLNYLKSFFFFANLKRILFNSTVFFFFSSFHSVSSCFVLFFCCFSVGCFLSFFFFVSLFCLLTKC